METFLLDATIYLAAAVIAVPVCVRFGLGSVLGYLLAGIAIGPLIGLVGAEAEDLRHFAEFGVVLMLFLIGLELEPRALWNMRQRLLGLGGLQIVLTTGAIAAAGVMMGFSWPLSITLGMIFALSSTAIVLQTLNEKKLMQTTGGRSAFSVLLMQDIAVIPMLVLMPLLAASQEPMINPDGSVARRAAEEEVHGTAVFLETIPAWAEALVTLGVIVAIILGGHYLTRPVFRFVHLARLREIDTAVSLLFVLGVAELMILVGVSPALGTFLAGVVLAGSEFKHELEADIEPFKGLLLGLFFIAVGAGINFDVLRSAPVLIVGMALGVMLVKGVILYLLAMLFHMRGRDKWLFTLGLAQAGEFGFVLVSFSVGQAVLPELMAQQLLLVIALTMLLTPLSFIVWEQLSRRMAERDEAVPEDEIDEQQPVIIAGVGRFGQVVNRLVQSAGFQTTVIDSDLQTIQTMRKFGFKGFFGDPTRPELLHAAGLKDAKVLVVALDDPDLAVRLTAYARRMREDLHIVARATDRVQVYRLFQAGANDIVRELFDSSLRAGRYVLENMGLADYEAHQMERTFYKMDREAVRELAALWKPGVPVEENEPYLARAKELNRELESALITQLDEGRKKPDAA